MISVPLDGCVTNSQGGAPAACTPAKATPVVTVLAVASSFHEPASEGRRLSVAGRAARGSDWMTSRDAVELGRVPDSGVLTSVAIVAPVPAVAPFAARSI